MELFKAHTQWANRPADERYQSLAELHQAVKVRDEASCDQGACELRAATVQQAADGSDRLRINGIPGAGLLTNWSAGQLFEKVGIPRRFIPTIGRELAVDVINDRIYRSGPQTVVPYVGLNNGGQAVRALVSTKYSRLLDSKVTEELTRGLPEGWRNPVAYEGGTFGAGLKPSGLYASDRDVFAFFVDGGDFLDLGGQDQLHRGFFVWNSEVGAASFGWTTFWFRVVCGNHIVWGASDVHTVSARHVRGIRSAFDGFRVFLSELKDGNGRDEFAAAVTAAKAEIAVSLQAGSLDEEIGERAVKAFRKHGLTEPETRGALQRILIEEPEATGTRWDWLQGFTALARTREHVDARLDLERRATKALLPAVR